MPKPFDATLKAMLEASPDDWPVLAGYPRAETRVIDADVSTFTAAADKVLRVRGSPDWIMHVEFQAGPDAFLPRRTHLYNTILEYRHDLMVRSVIVLLRPEARLANLTGTYERQFAGEAAHVTFRYRVISVWELPLGPLLAGGPGTLPLAPISAVSEAELPGILDQMKDRMRATQLPVDSDELWTATYILMGLRYPEDLMRQLLRKVMGMKESVTYQAIVAEGVAKGLAQGLTQGREQGAVEGLQKTVRRLGQELFGPPDESTKAALKAIDDLEELERLSLRLLKVDSWQALLAPPRPGRRKRSS